MEELIQAFDFVIMISPTTNKMNFESFVSVYCMLLEEWCKYNDQSIIDSIDTIHNLILEVNESEGPY